MIARSLADKKAPQTSENWASSIRTLRTRDLATTEPLLNTRDDSTG
jgi:hypothetical protein